MGIVGIEIFTDVDPLKELFAEEDLTNRLMDACRLSMVEILEKVSRVNEGLEVEDIETGKAKEKIELHLSETNRRGKGRTDLAV